MDEIRLKGVSTYLSTALLSSCFAQQNSTHINGTIRIIGPGCMLTCADTLLLGVHRGEPRVPGEDFGAVWAGR